MSKNLKLFQVPKIVSMQDMLLQSAKKYSDKLALEDLSNTPIHRLNYHDLLYSVLKFGKALESLGINKRTHIAIIGENRVQWAISYLTAMCFNHVIVPIDRNLPDNEILNILHESEAEVIIFSESYAELLVGIRSSLKKLKHFICMDETFSTDFMVMKKMMDSIQSTSVEELPVIDPNDLAEIIFTSGSLGRAKGVMLSQKNLVSNLMDMVGMLFVYPEDRFLSVLPMHHTYECTCGMLCPLYCGASVHYARSLKTIVDDIQKVKATMLLGVPLLFDKMFKKISKSIKEDKIKSKVVPPLVKVTDLMKTVGFASLKKKIFHELHEKFGGSVRVFIAGGAAPDPLVAKGLQGFGFNFLQGYGLTETSPILTLNQIDNFKDNAAGIPLPSVEIKINKPDADGCGEIWARGSNIMLGYYKNEKTTADAFHDDWFKTGDIGYIDEDGFLHINGRKKNVIISKSGKNVFPEEIEDILNRSPYILESMVFGEKDEKHDEIIACKIVVDAEAFIMESQTHNVKITDDMINRKILEEINLVNKQLPQFKRIIKHYIQEKEFEKTTTQKIKRYLVKNSNE